MMMETTPLITLAMIVRDAGETIGRCIDSVSNLVDGVVVCDTGSVDETKAIAERRGAHIVDFPWRDDFSAARNYAFSKADGDWILWLDADDVVVGDIAAFRAMLPTRPPDVGAIWCPYILGRMPNGEPTFDYWRERFVRRSHGYRWAGLVHEVLVSDMPGSIDRTDAIVVEHKPGPKPSHSDRNLRLMERQAQLEGADVSPRTLFYLGREYADAGDIDSAIATLIRYLTRSTWTDERYIAQIQIGDLLMRTHSPATNYFAAAMTERPAWPTAYFKLAEVAYYEERWQAVVDWCDVGRSRPLPETRLFIDHRALTFDWLIHYTVALWRLGRNAEALDWTRRALAIDPTSAWHLTNDAFFSSEAGGPR